MTYSAFETIISSTRRDTPIEHNAAVQVGVVQTAYANGMSTRHMREKLGLDALLAKTGVKYVHALAETFDIGIYFEANGHGTILFKDSLLDNLTVDSQSVVAKQLLAIYAMMNQAAGDAISNLLLVDVSLRILEWDMNTWAQLYQDLPSSMLKVSKCIHVILYLIDLKVSSVSALTSSNPVSGILRCKFLSLGAEYCILMAGFIWFKRGLLSIEDAPLTVILFT